MRKAPDVEVAIFDVWVKHPTEGFTRYGSVLAEEVDDIMAHFSAIRCGGALILL